MKEYLRNLLIIAAVIAVFGIFAAIFYPETLSVFSQVGGFFSIFNWWPLIILGILVLAIPRRR